MQAHPLKAFSVNFRQKLGTALGVAGLWAVLSCPLLADNVLHITPVQTDRPTLYCLGVQMLFSGDDNLNSSVAVQFRLSGTTPWKQALPLWRVHPEVVTQETVPLNYAGSIFDLRASTAYDIQLTISDPDGIVDQNNVNLGTQTVVTLSSLMTRAVPGDPANPIIVNVTTAAQLTSALGAAQPGDIITLAAGTYSGTWQISASGTAQNPIVIRGANTIDANGNYLDNTILDGGNCKGCNVLGVNGSYTHVEWLTIQNATRALRSFNATTANVYRRLHTRNTDYGHTGANTGGAQTDFYFADNILEGRIAWPSTCLTDKACKLSSVDGIGIWGHGHVVAHNTISGFGDAIANWLVGARALDFYGNDVLMTYDDSTEMDSSEGNIRYFRNRLYNIWEGPSVQPVNGGPAYIFRNIGVNVQNEQIKLHPNGTNETSGLLIYNNTFVSNSFGNAWHNSSSASCHYWVGENNLFQGPVPLTANEADVSCHQDHVTINYDSYNTDGQFAFTLNGVYTTFVNFLNLQAGSPLEHNGQLLTAVCANGSVFASCLVPPADVKTFVQHQDVTPGSSSGAIDKALLLPNINDQFVGAGPDVGAIEVGCVQPIYGPRPVGLDENKVFGCNGYQ